MLCITFTLPISSDPVPSVWAESRRKVHEGLVVVQTAVDLMNNNCFKQAEDLLKPKLVLGWECGCIQ